MSLRQDRLSLALYSLAALGSFTALHYTQKIAKQLIRSLVQIADPLAPQADDVQSLLKPLLDPSLVEDYIKERQDSVVSGAEKCVVWASPKQKQKTKVCVVFLHGWSAW